MVRMTCKGKKRTQERKREKEKKKEKKDPLEWKKHIQKS